jgi:hypothetical protein
MVLCHTLNVCVVHLLPLHTQWANTIGPSILCVAPPSPLGPRSRYPSPPSSPPLLAHSWCSHRRLPSPLSCSLLRPTRYLSSLAPPLSALPPLKHPPPRAKLWLLLLTLASMGITVEAYKVGSNMLYRYEILSPSYVAYLHTLLALAPAPT